MISTLFSSLNTNVVNNNEDDQSTKPPEENSIQPVLFVMQKTMPIMKDIGTIWINEHAVIDVWKLPTLTEFFLEFFALFCPKF